MPGWVKVPRSPARSSATEPPANGFGTLPSECAAGEARAELYGTGAASYTYPYQSIRPKQRAMTRASMDCRVGVDVGGTFTDVVCAREGRPPVVFKVPSTPADPGDAALAAVQRLAAEEGIEPGSIAQVAHGTTVATNAVLERRGGRLGIIATEGFRDTLEIGRQMRREMYEVRLDPQTPVFLAPRAMRLGVRERVGPQGEIVEPLDEASVRAALERLVAMGAECIAVCLLFSFVNPKHERRVGEIAREAYPGLEVSLSSEVDPAFREYERTAVTAFDAYIKPTVRRYLTDLGDPARRRRRTRPAPGDAVARRTRERGARARPSGAAVPVRPSRRCHRWPGRRVRGRSRGPHHPRRRRHELRHRARLRRQAAAAGRRADRRVPGAGADGGRERHRRGRGKHRVARRRGRAAGRAAVRRLRSRSCLLCARRDGSRP